MTAQGPDVIQWGGKNTGNSGVPISNSNHPSVTPPDVEESVKRNGGMEIHEKGGINFTALCLGYGFLS